MQMRGMGGESPFSCFDIIHLNIIRCVIRTPVIGQIFMLLDSFNFKFYYEIFKNPKSMGLLTQFEISQLFNSNFCFTFLLQTFASKFGFGNAKNECFSYVVVAWKLNICLFLYVENKQKLIQNIWMANQSKMIAFFSNPNERTELNPNEHTEVNVCLNIFAYLLDR